MNCLICQKNNVDNKHFYSEHGITLAEYFVKTHPKKDLHTGEQIPFKNKDQYLESDFICRNNMKAWLKSQPLEVKRQYCKSLLTKRIESKQLKFTPTFIELRSLACFPTQVTFDKLFGDYYSLCSSLGLINRLNRLDIFESFNETTNLPIKIDTREQAPLMPKDKKLEICTLNVGDYAMDNSTVRIERKSLADLIGTISSGFERFSREIERAKKQDLYLVVLVEEKLANALGFNYLPHISKKIKASPEFIFHRIREICQLYDNIQFLFADGRSETARLICKILPNDKIAKSIDLELNYQTGML